MRNKFVYSYSVKIRALGFHELLGSIFYLLLVVEAFGLQQVVKMLKEGVVSWWEVRWIWQMRQNFTCQFVQLLKCWLCNAWSSIIVEKNWVLSVDQCQLHTLRFLVTLTDVLNILGCNGFTRSQKAVVDQTPANTDHDFFLVEVWLWKVLCSFLVQPLSQSSPVVV